MPKFIVSVEKSYCINSKERKTLSVPEYHQKKIALSTLKMSITGAKIAGGMNHTEAIKFLKSIGYTMKWIKCSLEKAGHSSTEIQQLISS